MSIRRSLFVWNFSFTWVLACLASAQTNSNPVGYPRDWSHTRVIFTNGGNPSRQAAAQRDPRMLHNWLYRNSMLLQRHSPEAMTVQDFGLQGLGTRRWAAGRNANKPKNSDVDWAISLGPAGGVKPGVFPAKYTFDASQPLTLASCTNDFVIFPIGVTPGIATQANLVAFNNLYTGTSSSYCPNGAQTPPTTNRTTATFMWSYAIGSAAINLSPALSLDGKKVAVVESSTPAVLHVVTWVAGQGTNATTGAVAPGSGGSSDVTLSYTNITVPGCTATPSTNTNSAPFVDYGSDAIYIGANNGVLYRIKSVFGGTPTLDYCVTVSAGNRLTSPVLDFATNSVIVSDGRSVFRYSVGPSSFTAAGSIQVGNTTTSITDAPLVDSSNGFVYVFASRNVANNASIVSQIPISLASKRDTPIGQATNSILHAGTVDNGYFLNGPSGGTMYACGTQSNSGTRPSLYGITFAANGLMNTTATMSDNRGINNGSNGVCSPLTEYYNGTNDRLFVGTGIATSTTGANLVTMWLINSQLTSASTPSATATNEIGGTSGITIDNDSVQPQASSIYFGTLFRGTNSPCGRNLYCAVKLTQGALQ